MSEISDALDRVRGGEVVRFRTERRVFYIDAELSDDPSVVDSFYLHIYDSEEREQAYARSIGGLELWKTLSGQEYCVLPNAKAQKEMDEYSDEEVDDELDRSAAQRAEKLIAAMKE